MSRIYPNNHSNITQECLKELVEYCPETGIFTRKISCRRISKGGIVGSTNGRGYSCVQLDKVKYAAHRLAWFYVYGEWPKNEIDHINGVRLDNRFCNLRAATTTENAQNKNRCLKNNVSGYLGVSQLSAKKRFKAAIVVNKKQIYIGEFKTADEAHAAYLEAKRRLHPNCTI